MANVIKIKRSSVQGKIPTTAALELGELAINTYDGKLFLKQQQGEEQSIVQLSGADTYLAGNGLTLTGNTFAHADTSSAANLTANGRTYVTGLTFDTYGHVTGYTTGTETVVDTNTTYSISTETGDNIYSEKIRLTGSNSVTDDVILAVGPTGTTNTYGLTIEESGDTITFKHADTSSQASIVNSGNTFIQDITLDEFGHITAVGSAAVSIGDGTLTIATKSAGATNTDVTLELSGTYSANTTVNRTIKAVVGPALTNLATAMTGATTGFLKKSGVDTYTLDTNTYLTTQNTSKNIVGASGTATADAAATNGNVYLNHLENTTITSTHRIIGAGGTTVVSDASGNITITSGYTETDTLATVTGRGNTTTTNIQLNSGAAVALAGNSVAKIWTSAVTPANITANTEVAIDSFATATYRSAKYTIQLVQGTKYQQHEVRLIHDGTSVYMTEYAVLETNAASPIPVIFSGSIATGALSLRAIISDAATTNVAVIMERTLFSV